MATGAGDYNYNNILGNVWGDAWFGYKHLYEPQISKLFPPVDNAKVPSPIYTFTNDQTTGNVGDYLVSTGDGAPQWTSSLDYSNDIVLAPANDGVVRTTTFVADVIKAPIIESEMIIKLENRICTLEQELVYFKKRIEEMMYMPSSMMTVEVPENRQFTGGDIILKAGDGGCTGTGGDVTICAGNYTGNVVLENTATRPNPFKKAKRLARIEQVLAEHNDMINTTKNVTLFDKVMKEVM